MKKELRRTMHLLEARGWSDIKTCGELTESGEIKAFSGLLDMLAATTAAGCQECGECVDAGENWENCVHFVQITDGVPYIDGNRLPYDNNDLVYHCFIANVHEWICGELD